MDYLMEVRMLSTDGSKDTKTPTTLRNIFWMSLGGLIVGTTGYFTLDRSAWLFYIFAHTGAVGVMGLLGVAAAKIAIRKNRNHGTAFLLGFLFPIAGGILAVLLCLLPENGRLYCGGSISLLLAILVLVYYALARAPLQTQEG